MEIVSSPVTVNIDAEVKNRSIKEIVSFWQIGKARKKVPMHTVTSNENSTVWLGYTLMKFFIFFMTTKNPKILQNITKK